MDPKSCVIKEEDIQYDLHSVQDSLLDVGKGSFGVVKKGVYLGQTVAVKTLKQQSEATHDVLGIEAIMKEAHIMSTLSHSRIVHFYGCILEPPSIVMEYMTHGTLRDYIRMAVPEKTDWLERLSLAQDIAEGMAYLHAKVTTDGKKKPDLFHQDLKSTNVLLSMEQGRLRAKISDFGLAVVREECDPVIQRSRSGHSLNVSKLRQSPSIQSVRVHQAHQAHSKTSSCSSQLKVEATSDSLGVHSFTKPTIHRIPSHYSIHSFVQHQGGTLSYMAPELYKQHLNVKPEEFNSKKIKFTKACDVYAFGVILLELSLLEDPEMSFFVYSNFFDAEKRFLPDFLVAIIDHCLDTNAQKRSTFAEVFHLLTINIKHMGQLDPSRPSSLDRQKQRFLLEQQKEAFVELSRRVSENTIGSKSLVSSMLSSQSRGKKTSSKKAKQSSSVETGPEEDDASYYVQRSTCRCLPITTRVLFRLLAAASLILLVAVAIVVGILVAKSHS